MTDDEIDLKNKNAAAEYLGANALDLTKHILIKRDRAILEESHRLIQEAIKKEREECAKMAEAFHRHGYDFTGDLELHEAIRSRT